MDIRDKYSDRAAILRSSLLTEYWDPITQRFGDVAYVNGSRHHISHVGYVSLFPFLLSLLESDSIELKSTLDLIGSTTHLWSDYGILSLSRSDPLFGTKENYWRGPIWININYLILSSLHRYGQQTGPYQDQIRNLYDRLRTNLIGNLYKQYMKTGFLWEQYDPIQGRGQRSHPFTGWTALVVLIMAEIY